MLRDPGHHLGDAWFAVHDGRAHAWYLRCPDHVARHTRWEIAHATSTDLVHWERHGTAIAPGADEPCLATGSVLADPEGDGWLMAFTIGWAEARPRIGLARSRDLSTWEQTGDGPALPTDGTWATDRPWSGRPATHWRDPFLRRRPDGTVEALLCAASADAPADRAGAIAVARLAPDGTWRVSGSLPVEPIARELECPQVIEVDGGWFLLASTLPPLFADDLRARWGDRLRPGTLALPGEGPDGPFHLVDPRPILPAEHPHQPYAGQVVELDGRHHLIGTLWRHGEPDALSDPVEVHREDDRLVADRPVQARR